LWIQDIWTTHDHKILLRWIVARQTVFLFQTEVSVKGPFQHQTKLNSLLKPAISHSKTTV
jgi:hypothetical protein